MTEIALQRMNRRATELFDGGPLSAQEDPYHGTPVSRIAAHATDRALAEHRQSSFATSSRNDRPDTASHWYRLVAEGALSRFHRYPACWQPWTGELHCRRGYHDPQTWQPVLSAGRVDGRERCFGAAAAVMEQHCGRGQSTRKKLCGRRSSNRWVRAVPSWIKLRLISGRI